MNPYNRLLEVTKTVTSKLTLADALQTVVKAIADEVGTVDLVGYFERNPDGTFTGKYANKVPMGKHPETGETFEAPVTMLVIDSQQDPFAREIVQTMQSVYVEDAANDPRPNPINVHVFDMKSCFGLPVHYEGELFGLVFLHDQGKAMYLPPSKRQIVESFVAMAGVAIHNAQAFEDQQRLLQVTKELSSSLSASEVIDRSFKHLVEAADIQTCGIHLLHDTPEGLVLQPAHLKDSKLLTYEEWIVTHQNTGAIRVDADAMFKEVIETKRPLAIDDVFADPRPDHMKCRAFDIKSLMVLPLVAFGACIGIIALPSIGNKRVFEPRIVRLCQSIADSTAMALRNAMTAQHLDQLVEERTAELEQAISELRTLDEMKSDFIACVSHELRTPINIITQILDLFDQGILGDLDDLQTDYLSKMSNHVGRLRGQVEDLLDFSKFNSDSFSVEKQRTDYAKILRDVIASIEASASAKRISLTIETADGLCGCLDPKRIEQVLLNLLSNAIKFTNEGGEVKVKAWMEEMVLVTSVSDTGIGIPEDKLDRIFEKFYQADNSSTRRYAGTGLGLSIAKSLIEKHGGRLSVDSTLGAGTCFTFRLPMDCMIF